MSLQAIGPKAVNEGCGSVSIGQEGFFFLHDFFPDDQIFNIGLRLDIRGCLDIDALRRSLDFLVQRHDLLRTSYHRGPDGLSAKVHAVTRQELRILDLVSDDGSVDLDLLVSEEVLRRFDLESLPLLRAMLIHTGPSEHVLVLVMHHIIGDGTSFFGLYLDELTALYDTSCRGESSPLPPLQARFDEFVEWQRERNEGTHLAKRLDYWRNHLAGAPSSVDLPSLKSTKSQWTAAAGRIVRSPVASLGDRVDSLADRLGVWPSTVMFGAYFVLAGRYARQSDMVIGNHLANRKKRRFVDVFGPLVNVAPTRFQLRDDETFCELAKRLQPIVLRSAVNGDVALERIVQDLGSQSDSGRSQLHQIAFNYMSSGLRDLDWNGTPVKVQRIFPGATYLDLILVATRSPKGLVLSAEFKTDVFQASVVDRFLTHYAELLTSIVDEPDRSAVTLPFLKQEERSELLLDFNRSDSDLPDLVGVHDLFAQRVQEQPHAMAVEFEDSKLTYRDLDEKANQLAHYLISRGAGPERLVGICLSRSERMVIATLACFKAGAAYLPLDPTYPIGRLRFMIEDASIALLMAEGDSLDRLGEVSTETILLDSDGGRIASQPALAPTVSQSRDLLAYVIYTSGSTGKPKGVEVTHGCLLNFVLSMAKTPGFTCADRLLAVTTLSFDIAGLELYLPLAMGGTTILAGQDVVADGVKLLSLLHDCHATVMQATPSTWYMLMQAGWSGPSGLKVLCGGEAMPQDLASELLQRTRSVWNMYGPTETTIWSSCQQITDPEVPIRIGRPIANTRFYVLDPWMQPVPIGVAGELFIGGHGVARGYLHRPELTQERFPTNPFIDDPKGRIYRTGDLALVHEDGSYECLRRLDSQIKLHGHRIELGEIEAALSSYPGVDRVVANLWEVTPGDRRLVAYAVPQDATTLDLTTLRDFLAERLPSYMVPQHIVVLDALPQTPNGKTDRNALPSPEIGVGEIGRRMPRDDLQLRVAAVWQELLGFPEIAVDDVFFEIGGRSLLAIQLVSRLNREFDSQLGLATLFENPTIEQLAAVLRRGGPQSGPLVVPLQSKGDKAPLFCLCGVHLYYHLAQNLDPDRPVYGVFLPPEEELCHTGAPSANVPSMHRATAVNLLAARYKEEIQAVQPHGPYHLAGVCFGGLLAYEVGRQLLSEGESVESVVIMEAVIGSSLQFSWPRWVVGHLRKMLRVGPGYAWSSLLRRVVKRRSGADGRDIDVAADEDALQRVAGAAYIQAMRDHDRHMEPYEGTILFIRASNPPDMLGYRIPPGGGFKPLALGGITIREAFGDHLGILDENNAPSLAAMIRAHMNSSSNNG